MPSAYPGDFYPGQIYPGQTPSQETAEWLRGLYEADPIDGAIADCSLVDTALFSLAVADTDLDSVSMGDSGFPSPHVAGFVLGGVSVSDGLTADVDQ